MSQVSLSGLFPSERSKKGISHHEERERESNHVMSLQMEATAEKPRFFNSDKEFIFFPFLISTDSLVFVVFFLSETC